MNGAAELPTLTERHNRSTYFNRLSRDRREGTGVYQKNELTFQPVRWSTNHILYEAVVAALCFPPALVRRKYYEPAECW